MKFHIPIVIFLCIILSYTRGFAQDHSVSGYVLDSDNEPVVFANVILMHAKDSSLIKGVSTNEKGFFLLDNVKSNPYILRCSFIGYTDYHQLLTIEQSFQIADIVLRESSEILSEVSITYRKPTFKKEVDRFVFNIENSALVEGTIFDVLRSTPGILVMDNEIQVKNAKPIIYINDRKVQLSNEELVQLLESSSANAIKRVEVITNPSAKYDGESGAVINIVMSKNLITGYRGQVFGNYTQGVFPKYDAGMSHFFKNKKIDIFANYTYSHDKINRDQEDVINYLDGNKNIDQIFSSDINRNTWKKTHLLNINLDYNLDEKNILSFSSNMMVLPYFDYKINNNTQVFNENGQRTYYFIANNFSNDDKYNLGYDLDYVHKFAKEGAQLSANAHFTTYNYNRNQNVESNYFDNSDIFLNTTAFRTDNHQDSKIYTAKVDYTTPLGESSVFEVGTKGSTIKNESSITQFNVINGSETIDPDNTDAFTYEESILAAYVNISKEWEKFSLVAGLRTEQTRVKGFSVFDNSVNNQNYWEWFPSASLSYEFSDNFSLYTNYKRSIQRPNYQDLNPFQFYLNDYTIVTGNPNLQPIKENHAVLGTSFAHGTYTIEAYYKSSSDNIFELPLQDNIKNTITYTPTNLKKTIDYGLDFTTYFNLTEQWSAHFVTSFFNIKDSGKIDGVDYQKDLWANYSSLSNDLTLLKDRSLSANFSLIYLSKNVNGFRELKDLLFSNLSISKTILNKKATVSLLVSDLFNTQIFKMRSRYLDQDIYSVVNEDTRSIKLGFRYKFGNTNLKTNQRLQSQQETERLEKQGGN